MPRSILDESRIHPAIRERVAHHHEGIVREVEQAVADNAVVVVGMAQNPFVKRARKALEQAGHPFTYLEYGSYLGEWKKRLALKLWTGFPTFPMVFVRGQLLGGAEDTEKAIADGTLKALLDAK